MNPLRILIAVNFTESSDKAIAYSLQLLRTLDCHIRLIYCYSDFIEKEEFAKLKLDSQSQLSGVKEVFTQRLQNQEEQIKKDWNKYPTHGELTLSSISIKGDVEIMVNLEAESWQPNMIVAGSSVEKNTFTELMESTASDIIENTTYPVLIVPKNANITDEQIQEIIFITTFKSEEYTSLHKLVEMLPGHNSKIHCIKYLYDRPDQWDQMRLFELQNYVVETYKNQAIVCESLTGDHQLEELYRYIKQHNIGLLAITRLRRKFLFKFLHPNISKKVLHQSRLPILVFSE